MATKFAVVVDDVTTRTNSDGTGGQGAGQATTLIVGTRGAVGTRRVHRTYIKFDLSGAFWTDVRRITAAYIDIYSALPGTTGHNPKVATRRLTDAFTEGSHSGFTSADYTSASGPPAGQTPLRLMSNDDGVLLNSIPVTLMMDVLAPKKVTNSTGHAGGAATNYGFILYGSASTTEDWEGYSQQAADGALRPKLRLEYIEVKGPPTSGSNMTPDGAVEELDAFEADITSGDIIESSQVEVYTAGKSGTSSTDNLIHVASHGYHAGDMVYFTTLSGGVGLETFKLYYVISSGLTASVFKVSEKKGGTQVDITDGHSTVVVASRLFGDSVPTSENENANARVHHVPTSVLPLVHNVTYRFRIRFTGNGNQLSAWTGLVSFSVSNTAPVLPTTGLLPAAGLSVATLDNVDWAGGFTDVDAGDNLTGYQVQLAQLDPGDGLWDSDDSSLLWDTGFQYTPAGAATWTTKYTGQSLQSGDYHWRARVFDTSGAPSPWVYRAISLTDDFQTEPTDTDNVLLRPVRPWRIVIKALGANRGPGTVVGIISDAMKVGASIVYNSPGELHFTLNVDHPQIGVIEPKQTHYSVQFYHGDGWREIFVGLMWDYDATETQVIFYGLDYLALFDLTLDENFKTDPDTDYSKGGSKYTQKTISFIVGHQIDRSRNLPNSPTKFIAKGAIATMSEKIDIYSTYQPTLSFITGLLESHKAGKNLRTRIYVRKTATGYEVVVAANPGVARNNMRLRYGELVQGYRVIPFGNNWGTRVSAIGRQHQGVKLWYKTATSPGINEAVYGRINKATVIDDVSDGADMQRRVAQAAAKQGRLGLQVAVGIRTGMMSPLDGYNLCDMFPLHIQHGVVDTTQWGTNGYWVAYATTWEVGDKNEQTLGLTLQPLETNTPPSRDLTKSSVISPQKEWAIGWEPPNPLNVQSKYWLDQNTGKVYKRDIDSGISTPIEGYH